MSIIKNDIICMTLFNSTYSLAVVTGKVSFVIISKN